MKLKYIVWHFPHSNWGYKWTASRWEVLLLIHWDWSAILTRWTVSLCCAMLKFNKLKYTNLLMVILWKNSIWSLHISPSFFLQNSHDFDLFPCYMLFLYLLNSTLSYLNIRNLTTLTNWKESQRSCFDQLLSRSKLLT